MSSMTKAERDALVARTLGIVQLLGQRAAAREVGVNEDTVCGWVHRARKRGIIIKNPEVSGNGRYPTPHPDDPVGQLALEKALKYMSDRSKLAMATAGLSAADHFQTMPAPALTDRDTAQALESTSRTLDRTHGWSAERAKAPVVQIANITVPTPDQMQADKDIDSKLDRITALLASSTHK